jgi:hypothetical protein
VSVCKASAFFFGQVDGRIDFQRKAASAPLHKSHIRTFLLKPSANQNQARFELSLNSGSHLPFQIISGHNSRH